MTLINPLFSVWKSVGLELTIPMMYHTSHLSISHLKGTLNVFGGVVQSDYSVSFLYLLTLTLTGGRSDPN